MWDLSSPTRDWTRAPLHWKVDFLKLIYLCIYLVIWLCWVFIAVKCTHPQCTCWGYGDNEMREETGRRSGPQQSSETQDQPVGPVGKQAQTLAEAVKKMGSVHPNTLYTEAGWLRIPALGDKAVIFLMGQGQVETNTSSEMMPQSPGPWMAYLWLILPFWISWETWTVKRRLRGQSPVRVVAQVLSPEDRSSLPHPWR